jgi:hypothetical protein
MCIAKKDICSDGQNIFMVAGLTPTSNLVPSQINICGDGRTTSSTNAFVRAVILSTVIEPPKLNRFKCANYHLNG